MRRLLTALTLALPLTFAAPTIAAAHAGTVDCDDDSGLGPTPPSVYACRDPRGTSPFDDCLHGGVLLIRDQPIEYHSC